MRTKVTFVIITLFLIVLSYAEEADPKLEFILSYYKGDYARAHELLSSVSSDAITQQIWESRIHLRENIPNCKAFDVSNHSIQSLAQVRMGDFESAEKNFTEDWVSHWAKSIYRRWTGDVLASRNEV